MRYLSNRIPHSIMAFLVLSGLVFTPPALASSASDVLQRIKERAKAWSEIVEIIKSGDSMMLRIAAFEEAVRGNDPELRLSAMHAAFESDSIRLKKAALRQYFKEAEQIPVQLELPSRPSLIQDKFYGAFHGLTFRDVKVDDGNDLVSVDDQFWSGRLVQDGVDMIYNRPGFASCDLTMRIASPNLMTGGLDCVLRSNRWLRETEGANKVQLPATIALY
jgi:hypothetical protein